MSCLVCSNLSSDTTEIPILPKAPRLRPMPVPQITVPEFFLPPPALNNKRRVRRTSFKRLESAEDRKPAVNR